MVMRAAGAGLSRISLAEAAAFMRVEAVIIGFVGKELYFPFRASLESLY